MITARIAIAASPSPGTVIENQATGSYVDTADNQTKTVLSDIVKVTVAEVTGITITPANTPSAVTGSTVNFDFTITNVGNDPTQFFIPDAPSAISGGTAGTLKIVAYDPDGSGPAAVVDLTGNNVTVPAGGQNTGTLLSAIASANNGSIPPNATIVVRVPVTITATNGQTVSVTLGNTGGQPSNSNTPYIVGANGTGSKDLYTVDNPDGVSNESAGAPINGDATNHRQEASAVLSVTVSNPVTISGTVFSDADADVTINGSDAGTNALSGFLTIYAIDTAGKVVDKATVAGNGTYTLTNVPRNSTVTLRLSNDPTVAIGATAPTAPSIPSGWYYTGENLSGTIDPVITTLGDIALTTTTANLTNENFGIRQAYTIAADTAPTTCNPDYRTAFNTGVTAAGGQLAVGANDLNWTAEWIAGPASGSATPYAPPRPVGPMPAVVIGNLASGAWVNEPANARWINYPFRLSVNGNGVHNNADLDGKNGEDGSGISIVGTSDAVRLKFTSTLTLPSNANTIAISLPIGVAMDNQFLSIKVNGVENLVPTPAPNALDGTQYGSLKNINITNGWQAGVNTIEIIMDSGPPQAGFLLAVQATTTQVCSPPVTVSGTVFSDADANVTINGSDAGTNAGSANLTIYAINTAGKVLDKATVAANGTYTLANVLSNSSVTLRLSNDSTVAIGGTAPTSPTIPSNWVNTGENKNGTTEITTPGDIAVNTTTVAIPNQNFGIEQLPDTTNLNPASQTNPGGTATVQVPTLAGTDPEDGALGSGKKFKIVTLPTNGALTYNNTAVTAGQVISNYDPTLLKLDPQDGTITVSFTYAAVDAGGKEDPTPATVTIPFTAAACVKSAADGSYATSGKNKNSIWWLNFECYDEGIASTSAGQPFSFNLPDGSSMTLAVKKTGPKPATTTTLTTSPFSTFGTSSQYAGIPGKPAFYNSNDPASNIQDWTETLSTIVVKDKAGNIRNYTFVSADAENTNAVNDPFGNAGSEQLKFATNGTFWNLVELLSTSASPPTNTLTGLSSANATWTGNGNNNGSLIISTNNPTQVGFSVGISGPPSNYYNSAEGGLFGIGMPKITLVKNINGRGSPTDQFTTDIAYTAPTVSLKTATSTGTATTFTTGAVSVLPGNIINLKETIAAGSANPLTVYDSSIACTNVNATSTVLPTGTGTNFNITPQIGDDITCTITNTINKPNVLFVKRITAINGDRTKNPNDNTPLNIFVDDTTSPRQTDDNSPNWKANYLLGAINAGVVKPGDEIEYTVYFLNAGRTNANTVRICDRLNPNLDFKLNGYGASKDVQLQLGTSTVIDLTSASDASDRAELISGGSTVAATCNLKAANNNGTLVIDVTGNTGLPNLTTMPGSTGQGSPNDSYGFFRFVTKVKP